MKKYVKDFIIYESVLVVILIALIVMLLCGCKSVEYVPVPQVHTDTLVLTQHQRDSIYINDSTVIREKGDTVYITRWRKEYIERLKHDTLYQSRVDSIPYPVEVPVEVPAQLSWWEKFRIHIANVLLYTLLALGGWFAIKFTIKRFMP